MKDTRAVTVQFASLRVPGVKGDGSDGPDGGVAIIEEFLRQKKIDLENEAQSGCEIGGERA